MRWFRFDRHLSPAALVDLLEGGGRRASRRHVERCEECARSLAALTAARAEVAADEVPEPPAHFWQQLTAGIADGVDRISRESQTPPRQALAWLHPGFVVATAAGLVVVAGAAVLLWRGSLMAPEPGAPAGPVASATQVPSGETEWPAISESTDESGSWEVVLALAEEVDIDQASEVGLSPPLGSSDMVVSQLTQDERTELVRLIREEIGGV